MNHDTYLRIALLMRYVLAGAGLFTALWALHAALRDQANARQIRRTEAEFGAVAVLFVSPTEKKSTLAKLRGRSEEKPPRLGRSGSVGSGRAADVRIKGMGLDRRHFDYEIDKKTMRVFPVRPGGVRKYGKPGDGDNGVLEFGPGEKICAGKAEMYFLMVRRSREPESPMNRRAYRNKRKQPCGKK
ncbi:MAG: hypothetical protein IKX84_05905 [Clostridia bacterium]|nr:hypothetical protein [Clostridia bacterium]